jgi:hypothetical protein
MKGHVRIPEPLSFWKDAKNFGQRGSDGFTSSEKMGDERFRALFAGTFWPKMQNGRGLRKSSDSESLHHRGHEGSKTLPLMNTDNTDSIWTPWDYIL